ncbi:hypothetical protein RhiirA5_431972 [Rhizophagus irregularis]|uniref:Uncharacterized protein n=1 Tax=Rhizophagus irregularis TaxID=588596 RepID=A0A2N0NP92_9GLOM|nr:hypothetical protein RhiirA5_436197 [Rhizophagus irregularis]PKB96377.1 hypothetical protein RhiirA5_434944 [Rhizophagus irregularis]PKB98086.1 hypothetical protein RhiirA5_431972 [Rhizophagus irregularis]
MKEDISRTHTEEAMHNNFDKEKAKSKSQSISSPENENTSLIHNNVDDKSQQYNDDEVSSNLYDEDYCELSELNKGQQTWLNKVLEKQTWNITPEFKDYCSQFTEDTCNCVHTSTFVQKSFIVERFDPFLHEKHNIAQCICSFRMYQDVLDWNWMEMLTANTKNHKINGTLIALKTRTILFGHKNPHGFPDKKLMNIHKALKDVLKMVKSVNKSTINENVYKSEVETTSQKGKKAKRKGSVSA